MKIAIVDDVEYERLKIKRDLIKELAERKITAEIVEFESGETFMEAFVPGAFFAVFLDIYMRGMSGIDVGESLYQNDPDCKIIFLTGSEDYIRESYSVHATYYLVKPYELNQLQQALDFSFPKPKPEDILAVRSRDGMTAIPRGDIFYVEAQGRYSYIHATGQCVECLDSFTEVVRPLENDRRFFVCCRGVMVNLGKISAQKENDFIMTNGQTVPISRRIKSEALRAFQAFISE